MRNECRAVLGLRGGFMGRGQRGQWQAQGGRIGIGPSEGRA